MLTTEHLRPIRESHGASLLDFAKAAGCSESWLSRIENGLVRDLRVTEARRIALAYGVELESLFAEEPLESPPERDPALGGFGDPEPRKRDRQPKVAAEGSR